MLPFVPELFQKHPLVESAFVCVSTALIVSAFWMFLFMELRKDALEQINLTLTRFGGRILGLETPAIERPQRSPSVFPLCSITGPSDVLYDTLHNIIQSIVMESEDYSFVGPNGDNNEFLVRNDIDGIIVRNRPVGTSQDIS